MSKIVAMLLDAGSDVNSADNQGRNALVLASIGGNRSLVTLLVDKGIATWYADLDGNSALNWALIENHSDIFKVILNALPADSTSLSRESSLLSQAASWDGQTLRNACLRGGSIQRPSTSRDGHHSSLRHHKASWKQSTFCCPETR